MTAARPDVAAAFAAIASGAVIEGRAGTSSMPSLVKTSGSGTNSSLQFGQTRRTRRCAQVRMHDDAMRNGSMPMSSRRADGAGGVVRVQRGEHLVTGERGLHGDVRGFVVTNFTDHHDVRVLTENGAQGVGEARGRFPPSPRPDSRREAGIRSGPRR